MAAYVPVRPKEVVSEDLQQELFVLAFLPFPFAVEPVFPLLHVEFHLLLERPPLFVFAAENLSAYLSCQALAFRQESPCQTSILFYVLLVCDGLPCVTSRGQIRDGGWFIWFHEK